MVHSFHKRISARYLLVEGYGTPNFAEPFELTQELASLMQEAGLWGDVEAVASAKILSDKDRAKQFAGDGGKKSASQPTPIPTKKTEQFMKFPIGTELRLTKKMQAELTRTYKVFTDGTYAAKRWHEAEQGITKQIKDIIKKVEKDLKVQARGITVKVRFESGTRYVPEGTAGIIDINYKGNSVRLEPEGLYLRSDKGAEMSDAVRSWKWAAWLGADDSPFHSDSWVDAYLDDQDSQWFEQAGDIESDEDQIEKKIKDLLMQHEMGEGKRA